MFRKKLALFVCICLLISALTVKAQDLRPTNPPTATLAFTRDGDLIVWDIYGPDYDVQSVIANHLDGRASHPKWNADGSKLMYHVDLCRIWVVNADGSKAHPVSPIDVCAIEGEFSPDGSQIAYIMAHGIDDMPSVWVMNVDGSNVRWIEDHVAGCCLAWEGSDAITFVTQYRDSAGREGRYATLGDAIQVTSERDRNYPDIFVKPDDLPEAFKGKDANVFFVGWDPTLTYKAVMIGGVIKEYSQTDWMNLILVYDTESNTLTTLVGAEYPQWRPTAFVPNV